MKILLNNGAIFITLLPLQGVNAMAIRDPGCRFACPGLGAHWAFSPPCLNPKLLCYIFRTSTRDMIRWVTHLTMPPIDPKNPTKPYRTFVEFHPYQPSQKCFFVNKSLNFLRKKTTRYHSDTIPISFRRNTNSKMYPIFRQILRRHLPLSLKTCNL